MSKSITVKVLQEYIELGLGGDRGHCPLAIAVAQELDAHCVKGG